MANFEKNYLKFDLGKDYAIQGKESVSESDKDMILSCADKLRNYPEMNKWIELPLEYSDSEIQDIIDTAMVIKEKSELFIVIGIGGSFLGSKAIMDAVLNEKPNSPEIRFAGYNLENSQVLKLLKEIEGKETTICVISKSGTTFETSLAFKMLKAAMEEKYDENELEDRIYVITEKNENPNKINPLEKYKNILYMPKNIGGRYSVMTVVGLLPLAVAGIDIKEMIRGAKEIATEFKKYEEANNPDLYYYAFKRFQLENDGKNLEIYEYYNSELQFFSEWCKQLFGESQGKNEKGIFPSMLQMPRDLHSMGQFLQEGSQFFFETIISTKEDKCDLVLKGEQYEVLEGKSLKEIEQSIKDGVIKAHLDRDIDILEIEIPTLDEYNISRLMYFMMMNCALGGILMDVNPFDQNGVENYKIEVKKNLGL